jgi:hypothetical protein
MKTGKWSVTLTNRRKKGINALSNTQRSRRRREFLKRSGVTDIRIETSFVEKELFKRVAKATGFNSVSEYVVLKAIEHGNEHGITPEGIFAESKLGYIKKDV